jgi:hypothetical protein
MRPYIIGALIGFGLLLLIGALAGPILPPPGTASIASTDQSMPMLAALPAQASSTVSSPPIRRAPPSAPPDQVRFMTAVAQGTEAYRAAGPDQFAQGATRPARRQVICAAIGRDLRVSGWVGQVASRSTNSEGKGVLSVRLAPGVFLTTWTNAFSDIGSRTLIEPGTQVFHAMANLRTDDWVVFSGRFFESSADCVRESSMTLQGSMTSPRFIFQFGQVYPNP